MTPTVSIITPFYNAERYLAMAVQSVVEQSFQNWELLLIDDGSTDSCARIAENFSYQDCRIRIHRLGCNAGSSVARNVGIRQAIGRYIAFLDADDFWHPDKLTRQVRFMEKHEAALSCTSYALVDDAGQSAVKRFGVPSLLSYRKMLTRCYIGCLTAIYDTEITGKVYMPEIKRRHDYGLWLEIIRRHGAARGLDEVLAYHRRTKGSLSSNKLKLVRYNWKLMRDYEGLNRPVAAWYVSRQVLNRLFRP